MNNTKQFLGENIISSVIQYYYHFNQCKIWIFFPVADSSTFVEKAEANTQLLSVQPTSQLYKMGKTPIKLDRIIYFTQNYPTFLFFQAGIYALFQTTLFALDYPVFQNIYQVNSNSI